MFRYNNLDITINILCIAYYSIYYIGSLLLLQYNITNVSTSPAEQCGGRQVSMAVAACNCTGDTGLRVTVRLLTVKQQYDSNITVSRV